MVEKTGGRLLDRGGQQEAAVGLCPERQRGYPRRCGARRVRFRERRPRERLLPDNVRPGRVFAAHAPTNAISGMTAVEGMTATIGLVPNSPAH